MTQNKASTFMILLVGLVVVLSVVFTWKVLSNQPAEIAEEQSTTTDSALSATPSEPAYAGDVGGQVAIRIQPQGKGGQ